MLHLVTGINFLCLFVNVIPISLSVLMLANRHLQIHLLIGNWVQKVEIPYAVKTTLVKVTGFGNPRVVQ